MRARREQAESWLAPWVESPEDTAAIEAARRELRAAGFILHADHDLDDAGSLTVFHEWY